MPRPAPAASAEPSEPQASEPSESSTAQSSERKPAAKPSRASVPAPAAAPQQASPRAESSAVPEAEEAAPVPAAEAEEGELPGRFTTLAVRRWLPHALVLACLAGGAGTLLAFDKDVTLTVDGESRTLHTFANDVGGMLDEEGLRIGAHDIVAPSRSQELSDGDEVAVRYGRPMALSLDGERKRVWTTAETVDAALGQLGVRAEGADVSASRSERIGRSGMSLDVWTARRVVFRADGKDHPVRTTARSVREALRQAGLTLEQQDHLSVKPGSFPRNGETITVTRDRVVERKREERIPFHTVRKTDSSLTRGKEVVDRSGRSGLRKVTYEQRQVDGAPREERRLESEVVRKPRNRIVRVGTQAPKPVASAPTARSGGSSKHTSSGSSAHKSASSGGSSGGGSGQGAGWKALAHCESSGDPNAVDPSGQYGGLYQFDTRTWHSMGGSGRPQDASAAEQTARAKKLYASRGANPWPVCGRKLSR